jgi:hypothetical protein
MRDSVAKRKKDYTTSDLIYPGNERAIYTSSSHINGTKQRTRNKKNDATTRSRDSREADAIVLQKNRTATTTTKTDEKQQQNDDDDDESIIIIGRRRRCSEDFFTRRRG